MKLGHHCDASQSHDGIEHIIKNKNKHLQYDPFQRIKRGRREETYIKLKGKVRKQRSIQTRVALVQQMNAVAMKRCQSK